MALGAEAVRKTEDPQEAWQRLEHLGVQSARSQEENDLEGVFDFGADINFRIDTAR